MGCLPGMSGGVDVVLTETLVKHAADATGPTGTGLRIGTAAYMATEQALCLPVTPAADAFALGDESYEFDLRAGEVVPAETSSWYPARCGNAFVPPEDADAFVAAGYVLGPADCERGLATEPVTDLPFEDLADGRPFCVRSPGRRETAIVRLVHAEAEEGPVTVVLSRCTRRG